MAEPQNISDDLLIAQLRAGNALAFESIYRKFSGSLYRYTRSNISDPAECEEIIQDVFESLWARRESLEIKSLQGYLITAVRYKIIRYFRHNAVKKKYAEHFRLFESVYEAIEPEQKADFTALQEKINACLEELPERCKIAFQLRLTENLSNGEIAERMNIGKRTVELYISKAYAHLRGAYERIYRTG